MTLDEQLEGRSEVTLLALGATDRADQMRLAAELRERGWTRRVRRIEGQPTVLWIRPLEGSVAWERVDATTSRLAVPGGWLYRVGGSVVFVGEKAL